VLNPELVQEQAESPALTMVMSMEMREKRKVLVACQLEAIHLLLLHQTLTLA
jgi:hypothetical protein